MSSHWPRCWSEGQLLYRLFSSQMSWDPSSKGRLKSPVWEWKFISIFLNNLHSIRKLQGIYNWEVIHIIHLCLSPSLSLSFSLSLSHTHTHTHNVNTKSVRKWIRSLMYEYCVKVHIPAHMPQLYKQSHGEVEDRFKGLCVLFLQFLWATII
jgi:hypothetical protein